MLGHPPQNVQMVLADCKGGAGVKPFEGYPARGQRDHRPGIRPGRADGPLHRRDVGRDRPPQERSATHAGADDAKEYNLIRAEEARKGVVVCRRCRR